MIVRLARSSVVTLLVVGLVAVGGPSSAPESSSGPEISNFTIDPPFASSNGAARIRFEFRGAEGGLRAATLVAKPDRGTWRTSVLEEPVNRAIAALGPVSDGIVEATGQHQSGYTAQQRGTTNLYELRVTDRAGRKSNALRVELEVRP